MPQKKFEKNGHRPATLADIATQMAKSRTTESVRRATNDALRSEVPAPDRIGRKAMSAAFSESGKHASDRLDEDALSRMDDEGGAASHTAGRRQQK